MSEQSPPGVLEDAPLHPAAGLSPDAVAAVLADFRDWLAAATAPAEAGPAEAGEAPEVDLHTLLAQFTALRHEVNLQTRAARGQQEQSAEALRQLGQALESLRQAQAGAQQGQQQALEERLRPLLKTLVELYDALALAGREMQRAQETVRPVLEQLAAEEPPPAEAPPRPEPPPPARSFWDRWFGATRPGPDEQAAAARREAERQQAEARAERQRQGRAGAERVGQLLASLVAGYTMSLQRVERALRQHGLEPIPAVGQPFDPERMEVVEAVSASGRPSGEVLEEVRRGYLWNGRVFRYAQVRVAKG